jgi:hypothetical protein
MADLLETRQYGTFSLVSKSEPARENPFAGSIVLHWRTTVSCGYEKTSKTRS